MRPISNLGFEPPMFRGLSGTELTFTLILSLAPGIVLGLVAFLWTGSLLWIFPVLVVSALASVLCAGTVLLRLKCNHTPHWYLQRLARNFAESTGLVFRSGSWRTDF